MGVTDDAEKGTPGSAAYFAGSGSSQDGPVLYVLACPLPEQNGDPVYLMYQIGGVGCVFAYTDLDRLVECCGEHQPWLAVRVGALMTDLRDQQLPGPVVNLPLSPEIRWGADGPPWDLAGLAAAAGGNGGQRSSGDAI